MMKLLFVVTTLLSLQSAVGTCQVKYTWQVMQCELICSDLGWDGEVHPGHAAGDLAPQLDTLCGATGDYYLTFNNCSFANNRLEGDWFTDQPTVQFEGINIWASDLATIEDGTIGKYNGFKNSLGSMVVTDSPLLKDIRQGMVLGATSFYSISLIWARNGEIEVAEVELVIQMAQYLKNIHIAGSRLMNVKSLANMTGVCQPLKLKKLETVVYSDFPSTAGIPIFSRDIISAIESPNLKRAEFNNAGINMFEDAKALEPLATMRTLSFVTFEYNLLETVPSGLFDPLLQVDNLVYINIGGNPWQCDGNLQYLQDVLNDTSDNLIFDLDKVTCSSPPPQAGKRVVDVDLTGHFIPVPPAPRLNIVC